MKNCSVCLLFFLILPFFSFAQIAKKNTIFDGGITGIANDLNISNRVEWDIRATPSILYFLSDDFAVGGQLTAGATPDDGGIAGFTLASRYYFGVVESQALFMTLDAGFERFDVTTTWRGNIGIGYDYFLTRSIALETIFSFGFARPKNKFFATNPNQLRMNLGTGIKVFFDRSFDYYKDRAVVLHQGNFFIGGSFAGLEIVKVKQERNNGHTFTIRPNIGYFLTTKLLLGTTFTYFKNKAEIGAFKITQIGLTGFARYYLTSNANRGILFVEMGTGFNKRKGQFSNFNGQTIDYEYPTAPTYYGKIGIDFFFTPKVALESKIGFERDAWQDDFVIKQGLLDVSLQFFLGK